MKTEFIRHAASAKGSALPPYSEVVTSNGFAFLSGQVPVDADGRPVRPSVSEQTKLVLDRIGASLAAVGLDFTDVVKVQAWLTDASHFANFNAVYATYFAGDRYPARSTVISTLAVAVDVEIEVLAALRK